ncbi:TetR family transcriptional regulator [Nocardia blacklockiae]|uniref:TetR/AcrR family transcriptional regulator n=1 Tax=Nocardia blacklockiae TaxID=480036 RepID=UPI001895CBC4|nr:TetR family transcriptional regulator [Nocardia blacklockiae]MBF6176436.1 TetR family transcriptional regulator [Nocardia blacklockiae]
MSSEDAPGTRKRDAAATRAALLTAAQELFAERGYERATVRDIAARAGVNQALLFRYFGSKEELFRAAIADRGRRVLADGPVESLLARLLERALVPVDAAAEGYWLQAALRSSGHDEGASVIRRELGEEYLRALSELTDAPDGALRADLLLAWLLGIGLMRSVHRREPLAGADPADVARHVLRAAQTLLPGVDTNYPPAERDSTR